MVTETLYLTGGLARQSERTELRDDAFPLLTAGPVYFKVTRRLDLSLLSWWQRWGYEFLCRRLPARWRVPPVVPMERGGFATFAEADAVCASPDDQILVLPWGWAYAGEVLDAEVVCRPRDPKDKDRYHRFQKTFNSRCVESRIRDAAMGVIRKCSAV
jgi:hypothetical protein